MEKIKNFHYYNLVLAAKHWYSCSKNEDIYDFVLRLVKLEDKYIVFDKVDHKGQAVTHCLRCLDELAKYYRSNDIEKWWDSYSTMKGEVEKYMNIYGAKEYEEAMVLLTFNILMMLSPTEIELPRPIYGKGYPRMNNNNGMTYKEMRRKADRIIWKN